MNTKTPQHLMRASNLSMFRVVPRLLAVAIVGVFGLAGCGGGAGTAENPNTNPPTSGGNAYNGPVPATSDIQAFKTEFFDNVRGTDRCGNCHNAGGQAPQFARSDDVNQAYQQANGVVDRNNPALSRIVTKVAGGHNCWRGDPGACAADLTRWIQNWIGASGNGGKQIQLVEPTLRDPGTSKRFPPADDTTAVTELFTPLYDKLDLWCSGCHQADSATAQSPYFAAGGRPTPPMDQATAFKEAYIAAMPKINLNDPAQSRFVIRLRNESHNCFSSDCKRDADELQALIQAMADKITVTAVPADLTVSKALTLYDGTVASGGSRYEANMIGLYEFKTGQGSVAFDTSGVSPAADLNFTGDVSWVGGWGINIRGDDMKPAKAQASTTSSRKYHQLITATGEYSIEAWVIPGNVTQEDARIVSYSGSTTARNFTMGQQLYNYEFAGRSTATSADGGPRLSTDDDAERLQASLQHVVMTFDPINGRRIYVNGEFTGDVDGSGGGTLGDWDNSFAFVLGNEVSNNRQWNGVVRLVAIHNRALTQPQIKQNFDAGVGEKFFLLFGVSHIISVPKAYVMFEVTQYDSFSYLFNTPKFISLDPAAMPGSIPLVDMRIGVNGAEAVVGQAYRTLNTTISNDQYSAATGQLLSSVGTIIPLELGPTSDEFFLCFKTLGTGEKVCSAYAAGVTPAPAYGDPASDIGVKMFDAINATMASITGVDPNNTAVKTAYTNVRQSLPATQDIEAYLSSHQTSVAQLALTYCSVMVNNDGLRSAFFPNLNINSTLADPSTDRTIVLDNLMNKGIGNNLANQPASARTRLNTLMTSLCASPACGTNGRTAQVVTAACGAALGSAATLVQ